MTFKFVHPTIAQVAQIALDAADDQFGERVLNQGANCKLVVDAERSAYLLQVASTMRHDSMQQHYMMYYLGRFWHLRTRGFFSNEVGFYNFPFDFESSRHDIERCFADAIGVFGWCGDALTAEENATFIPVFFSDDYEPPDF